MTKEEKIVILGALFHDIGKFQQRCTMERKVHTELGAEFLQNNKNRLSKILDGDEAFSQLEEIVLKHHQDKTGNNLVNIIRLADHISAGERVSFGSESVDEPTTHTKVWGHIYLSSILGKLRLHNNEASSRYLRYYAQKPLGKEHYNFIIPQYDSEKDAIDDKRGYRGNSGYFEDFKKFISDVLDLYESDEDFYGIVNLILIIFEKYLWCVPDFTGSSETDISLFNHLKDVAAFAHAIYNTQSKDDNAKLALIIADIPGIQNYIFDIASKKPAKILRGRSIFVQVLSRIIATKFTKNFGLTEASIIMLAGGKFYILAPFNSADKFNETLERTKTEIDDLLIKNFNYRLSFTVGIAKFTISDLITKVI